jgi:ABC-type sugar transport system ATPase subunit
MNKQEEDFIIEIRNVSKFFGEKTALESINYPFARVSL